MYFFKFSLYRYLSIAWIICTCIFILDGKTFAQSTEESFDLFFLYSDQINYWQQLLSPEEKTSSSVFTGTTPDETTPGEITLGEITPLPSEVTYDPFQESPIKSLIYIRDLYSDEIFSRKSNYPEWDHLFDQYLITYCNPFLYIEDDLGTIISIPFDLSSEIEGNDEKEKATIIWIERKYQLTFTNSTDVDWIKFPLIGKGAWELELTPFFRSDPTISPFKVSTVGNLPTQPQFEDFSSTIDEGYNGYLSYSSTIINYNAWGGWVYIKITPYSDQISIDKNSFPVKYYLNINYKNYYDDVSIWEQGPVRDLTWYHITPVKREPTLSTCMTTFLGRVVDSGGTGVPGIELTLTRDENFGISVLSGGDGYFLFSPISSNSSGLEYELKVADNSATCEVIGKCGTIYLNPDTYSCLKIDGNSFLDPDGDADGDGITNSRERIIGTNPLQFDILFDEGLNFFRYPLWIYNPEKSIDLGKIIPPPSILNGIIIDPYDMPDSDWQKYYDASGTIPISNKSGGIIYLEKATALSLPAEYGINYLDLFDPSGNAYNPYYCSMINLYEGRNLLGLFGFKDKHGIVHPLGDEEFSSFYFLDSLKSSIKEDDPSMIMTVDNKDGKWQSTYSFFGRTSGKEYNLKLNKSYLIIMNKDKGVKNWVPGSY